jgi:integrase
VNSPGSEFTPTRLAGLNRYAANLPLPRSVDWLEDPRRVLEQPRPTTPDVLEEVLTGFLTEHYSVGGQTGDTYCSAVRVYLGWCGENAVDPFLVTRPQASKFASWLASSPSEVTRQPRSASRRKQILCACTGLIEYAVSADARPEWSRNPFSAVKKPKVDQHPKTRPKLTVSHVNRLVIAARDDHLLGGVLGKLLVAVPARMGLRPGDLCRLNVCATQDDGQGGYELAVPVKGGKTLPRWLPPDMASDFYTYLKRRVEPDEPARPDEFGPDPLFVHPRRRVRVNTDDLLRLLRRAAVAAGLPFAGELCVRDLRPFFNTLARQMGSPLEDRRVGLGHASARTTEVYDRTEWAREHDPAIRVSAAFDDYPAESRLVPLTAEKWLPPPVERRCDCTPVWPKLLVDLTPFRLDQLGLCEITDEHEPGTHQLAPYCARCRVAYDGPFRVVRLLDDPEREGLRVARERMAEAHLYPDAIRRREERRRAGGAESTE